MHHAQQQNLLNSWEITRVLKSLVHHGVDFTGDVLIDDAGFFETGFSSYEIKGLYNDGLEDFLEAMPVEPSRKSRYYLGQNENSQVLAQSG